MAVSVYKPWHTIWIKILGRVSFGKQLHPKDGKDVDHNDQQKRQISQSTQRGYNNTQQHFHRRPTLGKF